MTSVDQDQIGTMIFSRLSQFIGVCRVLAVSLEAPNAMRLMDIIAILISPQRNRTLQDSSADPDAAQTCPECACLRASEDMDGVRMLTGRTAKLSDS